MPCIKASEVEKASNVAHTQEYLQLYSILSSCSLPIVPSSVKPTLLIFVVVYCTYQLLCGSAPPPIPITWLRYDTAQIAKLRAVSSGEMARKPISISYNKPAAFDTVFSFHQQLSTAPTARGSFTTQAAVRMQYDTAQACAAAASNHLRHTVMLPSC